MKHICIPRTSTVCYVSYPTKLTALFADWHLAHPFQDSNRGNMIYRDREVVRGRGSGPWFTPVQDHVFDLLIGHFLCYLILYSTLHV
jgi:hypothetical protein